MRQTIKAKHQRCLHELKDAVNEFLLLTEDLALLKSAHETVQEIAQAVAAVQQLLRQNLVANKLVKAVSESEAAALLDEIVDTDVISELEEDWLAAADGIENSEVTQFLAEMMDKVERKYNLLLEKAHTYNALLKG
ncbi:MAG: hypothetical protein Q7U38_17580 [Methylobacter sp.]|nr:hypothetical protein [Methylobacter sp.]MDP2099743.1 hypothetical protein [Methylobacter sp.]MDP2430377.1 hypothetical protein [Methylobacter sp.]MDP3053545.1 hypothetical protein [Methylobacter sp.]MDP3362724.1 hypothetical protein [Methylobacter sp.]